MLPTARCTTCCSTDFGAPLVATSANLSGEPVLTDKAEVEARLGHVADAFLHHDRPIARPADDPVCRIILGQSRDRCGSGAATRRSRSICRSACRGRCSRWAGI